MNKKLSASAVVSALAEQVSQKITRKVIRQLQEMKDSRLSADDSGLLNTWDEICVQVQDEQSFFWESYDDTVRVTVNGCLGELAPFELEAIWLQTDQAFDWDCEDETDREPYPVDRSEIISYLITEYIYRKAEYWSNSRIAAFLDR